MHIIFIQVSKVRDGRKNVNKSFCLLRIADYLEMGRQNIIKRFYSLDSKTHIMSRRKTNLGRHSRCRKRLRRRLLNMTEEKRASVRERNRLRTIQMRNMEPPERRAARLEDARLRARQSRSAASNLVRSQ